LVTNWQTFFAKNCDVATSQRKRAVPHPEKPAANGPTKSLTSNDLIQAGGGAHMGGGLLAADPVFLKDQNMKICSFRSPALVGWLACVAAGCGARTPAVAVQPPANPDYVIAVDDVLSVTFWQEQVTATDVIVRPDGKISLPLLNDVQAAGYTPLQLADKLEEAAARFITEPEAAVIVKEIRSRKVFVLGEVATPGMVPLAGDMTVLQLIAMSGGLLEYADKKNIVIIRTENGHEQRLKFNYNEVVDGKNVQQNIFLRPGDTVVVNETGTGIPLF
jgi:polysaccharide export outer membrane protein